jgi:transcriptional regulator with XRE-family HTH domain
MVNTKEFSKRLQKIFDYYDLNASAFADKIEVGRATISHLLSGRNKPSLDFVMRVIKTFPEVELYWLLNGKGEFPKSDSTPTKDDSQNLKQKPISKNTTDSAKTPVTENITQNLVADNPSQSEIERIVIFYKNGVFKTYTPE